MSIRISFEGRCQQEFLDVTPHDIKIEGKHLYVKNCEIVCNKVLMWDLFRLMEKASRHKYGELFIGITHDGDIRYCDKTSDDAIDYGLRKMFGQKTFYWQYMTGFIKTIPTDDTHYIGRYEDEMEY